MRRQDKPSNVFSPEEIERLQEAFARSWRALSFAFEDQNSRQVCDLREALAKLIVNFASYGVKDPIELANRSLANLLPYGGRWKLTA